jgi:quinol monooxygenase YgiN
MLGDISGLLIYVDTSDVREGAVEELKRAIKDLVEFIDANEPQIVAYSVYLSDDGREMTVVHVHADAASLEYHLDVAGPAFRKLADLITLASIRVYGEPSERALMQLHDKARLLGRDDVAVHALEAGFSRIGFDWLRSPTG